MRQGDHNMTFDVEVLLKGTDAVITETVTHAGGEPAGWTDADVHAVLLSILQVFARANNLDRASASDVSLSGLSWIVTDTAPGAVIAIEIPSGAVAAGPFGLPAEELTQMVARVIASGTAHTDVH